MIRCIAFGELQSIHVVLLLDVLITLFLETEMGLSLQIFDLQLSTDLHDQLPQSLLR